MKIAKKSKDMGIIATILSTRETAGSAVDIQKLVELSKLTEDQIKKAIEEMKDVGMNVAETDDQPPRFYWSDKA